MTNFLCTVCNETLPSPAIGGTGYGTNKAGEKICYSCCTEQDKKDLLTATKYLGYINLPAQRLSNYYFTVTNWPGGELMKVVRYQPRRLPFGRQWSSVSGKNYYTFHAIDVHGQEWVGQGGGVGLYATFRKLKRGG